VSRARPAPFRGRHFADVIIILCVRWYLRYSLSYRDLKEIMAERGGLAVDHVTDLALGSTLYAPFESGASPRTPTSQRFLAGG
jgi:transposase-like protein